MINAPLVVIETVVIVGKYSREYFKSVTLDVPTLISLVCFPLKLSVNISLWLAVTSIVCTSFITLMISAEILTA